MSGPPRIKGFGWIARGFWVRDGELLALASHFNAPGYTGEGLSLEAFRWDPLTLAISSDGLVYKHLFYLIGGRHVDYPHMIEHDGHLLIVFSGAKQTVEVIRVSLSVVDGL